MLLPQGGEASKATVVCRKRDHDGRPIGKRHANPLLDTRLYEVEFPDGTTKAVSANLIAENLLSQVDEEGRSYSILGEIVDHQITERMVMHCQRMMASPQIVRANGIHASQHKVGNCKWSGAMVQQLGFH